MREVNIAEYDQVLAQARQQHRALVATLADLMAKRGEVQAVADVIAFLRMWDPTEVQSVLVAGLLAEATS